VRVLYLSHRLPYAANRGDRIRAYHVLRHLSAQHHVDLASLVHDDEEASHIPDLNGLVESVTVARVRRIDQLHRAGRAVLTRRPLTHALLDARGFQDRLADLVSRRRPDAVLALCSGMARFALLPPLASLPFVLDMVDVDSEKWSALGETSTLPKAWIYRREAILLRDFERRAVDAAHTTLVVNERERDGLRALGCRGDITVIPNGVELAGFRPHTPPSDEPRAVFCGVMNYEPNETAALWLAREVWPRVRQRRPDARLTLLGANPTTRIRRLAQRDNSIEVTGSVPDVKPFLWQSAVSVAPLKVARGIQNKVLEAVAAQLPTVISTAVFDGLPADVLPACVRADSVDSFAAAIVRVLNMSPAERREMAGRAALDRLTWPRRLTPLESILQSAAGGQRRIA
jgi:sugar transferase (PEP-CTERM/EpsH1 system associated)